MSLTFPEWPPKKALVAIPPPPLAPPPPPPSPSLTSACSDAEEAARRRNGYELQGYRMRVEIARGGDQTNAVRNNYVPPRNSAGFRVLVKGLPKSASWQDLKVCEVPFAIVHHSIN